MIISQEICEVCSAYTNQVNNAMKILDKKPEIFAMNPHDINGILNTIEEISRKIHASKKGTKLIEMDPRGQALRKYATHMLQFKSGADVALLNSIMYVILEEELYDKEYIQKHTLGFEQLKNHLLIRNIRNLRTRNALYRNYIDRYID